MNNFRLPLLAIVATTLASASFASTFDTMSSWDGQTTISSFGNPNSATFGQTFVAPTNSFIQDYSFQMLAETGTHFQMRGLIFDWTGSLRGAGGGATGTAVYKSDPLIIDGNDDFQTLTFNPNITLVPGHSYVAAVSISDHDDYDASAGTGTFGFNFFDHSASNGGGGFVWLNNENDTTMYNGTWTTYFDYGDAAFNARFAPIQSVPEPTSMVALAGGALAFFRRRRRS